MKLIKVQVCSCTTENNHEHIIRDVYLMESIEDAETLYGIPQPPTILPANNT